MRPRLPIAATRFAWPKARPPVRRGLFSDLITECAVYLGKGNDFGGAGDAGADFDGFRNPRFEDSG